MNASGESDRPTLLIVDDQQSARDTLAALLHVEYGDDLLIASSGQEALACLANASVDLVLCDVMMPLMDGFDVCRAIKAHEHWRFIPVILVTALDGRDDMVRGLDAGADEFLSKPVDKVVLRARVNAMLRIRNQYRDAQARAPSLETLLLARREELIQQAKLTDREREVLELLLLGRTLDEVGTALGISGRTAKFHQENLLRKLGADSRMDLLRLFA